MSSAPAVAGMLASAVIVLGGMAALARAAWRVMITLRDNTTATRNLTSNLDKLTVSIDGRFDALVARVTALESRRP